MKPFLTDLFREQSYDKNNFFLFAGPCVVENEELLETVASKVSGICKKLGIPYVFKSSYRKANRTSGTSFTGLGDEVAMEMLKKVGSKYKLPVVTDIHAPAEAARAAEFVDVLQMIWVNSIHKSLILHHLECMIVPIQDQNIIRLHPIV